MSFNINGTPLFRSQAMLKLNRKLQPMVDEIDANRNKWQELCSSDQEPRRASVTDLSPEPQEQPDSTEECGSKSEGSQDLRCRVSNGSCDDGNKTSAGNK